MRKPSNYENTSAYSEYVPLAPGGYVCEIKKVEETTSRKGKEMINIFLDIAEGEDRDYFADQYRDDTRESKKWGCIVYQLTEDNDGNCSRGLKSFIGAVKASNSNFDEGSIWGDDFAKHFQEKLVGGLFRREQYKNKKGELKWSTKCFAFRSVDSIRDGVDTPEDKYLDGSSYQINPFAELEDDDGDLPF